MFKLYVTLSDFCNFSCAHCINSSGPKAKRWRLTESERVQLVELINSDTRIKQVMFSGGEPTLQVETIKKIQREVVRPVDYRMTSNGWLGSRFSALLDEIKVDAVTLSFDKYHQPFVAMSTLIDFVEASKRRAIPVTVNFVFDSIVELADAEPLVAAGARLETCRLIRSGRGKDLELSDHFINDHSAIQGTCPSLNQDGADDLEKIVFVPGAGLTPCCGPLAFDALLPDEQVYSPLHTDYLSNPLRTRFLKSTFCKTGEAKGINLAELNFGSRCEACTWLNAKRFGKSSPSMCEFLDQVEETAYYAIDSILDRPSEQQLGRPFLLSYFLTCPSGQLAKFIDKDSKPSSDLKVVPLDANRIQAAVDFLIINYYRANACHYSEGEIEALPGLTASYFEKLKGEGRIYLKHNQIVGLILKNNYALHPAIQAPTTHIGYWGYDRSLITREEAQFIKGNWFEYLTSGTSADALIDCSIDWFNEKSFALAIKLGFQLKKLRLDRREIK